jgi:ribonuclease HI
LLDAVARHVVHWQWIKGHNGHAENERVDKLASDAALEAAAG